MYWKLNGKNVGNLIPGIATGIVDGVRKLANRTKNGQFAEPVYTQHGLMQSMRKLFHDYRNNPNFGKSDETERYFKEFVENGGMTGFSHLQGVEEYDLEIQKILKGFDAKHQAQNAAVTIGKAVSIDLIKNYFKIVESLNEAVENQTRFCAYYASRRAKRSITRSISDAKDVSVNFNKTGAGFASTKLKNMGDVGGLYKANALTAGLTASWLKNTMWFYNAGVQGMSRTYQVYTGGGKKQKMKALVSMAAVPFGTAIGMALLNAAMASIDSDDDRKKYGDNPYMQLPEYDRRDNMCFYLGHGRFLKLPLAIETRAMYALGDIAMGATLYPESLGDKSIPYQMAMALAQMTPTDIFGGSKVGSNDFKGTIMGAITPSTLQPVIAAGVPGVFEGSNVGWTGTPISYVSDWNENDPKWQHANPRTSEGYKEFAKKVNKWTGGDDIHSGEFDIDASKMEYLVNSYLSARARM